MNLFCNEDKMCLSIQNMDENESLWDKALTAVRGRLHSSFP